MASVLKRARRPIRRALSLPMRFPTSGFKIINSSEVVDEERFDPMPRFEIPEAHSAPHCHPPQPRRPHIMDPDAQCARCWSSYGATPTPSTLCVRIHNMRREISLYRHGGAAAIWPVVQPKLASGYGVSPYDINARLELSCVGHSVI
jgi:hypothetical protein